MADDRTEDPFGPDDLPVENPDNPFDIPFDVLASGGPGKEGRPRGNDDPDRPVEDGMHPPTIPQLVQCIHCGEEYDSWRIEWRVDDDGNGVWHCPMPGCDGAGFGIDIWPVDYDANGHWTDPDGREMGSFETDEEAYDAEEDLREPDAEPFLEDTEDDLPF